MKKRRRHPADDRVILFLLFTTLLLWMYLVILHPDPNLVIIPAGSIELGLSCFRAFHMRHGGTRWHAFSRLRSEAYALVLVLTLRHLLIPLVLQISGDLGGDTATPSLFEAITQRVMEICLWPIAGLLLLMSVLHILQLLRMRRGETQS